MERKLRAIDDARAKWHLIPLEEGPLYHAPEGYLQLYGELSVIEISLRPAQREDFPFVLGADDQNRPKLTKDVGERLTYTDALLKRVADFVSANKDFNSSLTKEEEPPSVASGADPVVCASKQA